MKKGEYKYNMGHWTEINNYGQPVEMNQGDRLALCLKKILKKKSQISISQEELFYIKPPSSSSALEWQLTLKELTLNDGEVGNNDATVTISDPPPTPQDSKDKKEKKSKEEK